MGPTKQYAQSVYGAEPTSMDELGFAVVKVLNNYKQYRQSAKGVLTSSPNAQCIGLAWRLTHTETVSNSHSGPEGYPQNFMRKKDVPTSYPGWSGRVWVRYKNERGYSFGSDPFSRSLTHTGTGGGGSYDGPWTKVAHERFKLYQHGPGEFDPVSCYSWDFRIFDADWPLVTENIIGEYEKQLMWARLNNKYDPPAPTHNFLWEDPKTKAADEEFLANCLTKNKELVTM